MVNEETARNTTGSPVKTICPSTDSRRPLVIDENVSRFDETIPFPMGRALADVLENWVVTSCGLEEQECVIWRGYVALKRKRRFETDGFLWQLHTWIASID